MLRPVGVGVVFMLAMATANVALRSALGEEGKSSGVVTRVTLKDQLEKALRARRPNEFKFIAKVVAQVDSGELPRDLVQSSFNWARKRPSKRIQYFEQSLKLRARRKGLALATDGVTTLR